MPCENYHLLFMLDSKHEYEGKDKANSKLIQTTSATLWHRIKGYDKKGGYHLAKKA